MFKLDSEQDLVETFRPRDRSHLRAHPATVPREVKYPLFVRDYFSWTDPSGFHAYVVFNVGKGAPTGIAFRRAQGGGEPVAHMCDWCHSFGTSNTIGLMTTDMGSKKRVGVNLCLDLNCRARVNETADLRGQNGVEASRKLLERIGRFAQEALGIDLSGDDRDSDRPPRTLAND